MEEPCPNCVLLEARVEELTAQVADLQRQLTELQQQFSLLLQRDSQNSHQPPSKDLPWTSRSERRKSDKASGGQKGHKGKTLKMSEHVDQIVVIPLEGQCGCGHLWDTVDVDVYRARQVHDLPEIRLLVTEYQAEVKTCPHCQSQEQAKFPEDVPGQVQYGPRLHGLAVNLTVGHFLPLERTCEVLEDLCGADISEGTLVSGQQVAAQRLLPFEQALKTALQQEKVLYADETGSKVSGKLHWIHVVSSKMLTLYGHHQNRGLEAVKHMGVLPKFEGILMHDAWQTYFQLPAQHTLCNAHLLRELKGLALDAEQQWAGELRTLLKQIYHQRKEGMLSEQERQAFKAGFVSLIDQGLEVNPANEPRAGKRGRAKQSVGRNLALRLQKHQTAVLRFLEDPEVPFDNNQAERDIRMVCVKRKVSGGFRSERGGEVFCRIRSYLSTLRKQGLNALSGLTSIFQGRLLLPHFSC